MPTSAAARIPPELFPSIIDHLDPERFARLPRSDVRGELNWSLVCVSWAQQCRQVFFQGIWIGTMKQAAGFRNLVMGVCSKRLTPLVDLIESMVVEHRLYADARALFPTVGALLPRLPPSKLRQFRVWGPALKLSADVRLRSPLWATPSRFAHLLAPYRELRLFYLHFASLGDVARFVDHFPHLEELELYRVAWDKNDVHVVTPSQVAPRPNARRSLRSIDVVECTDDLLSWQLLALGPKPRTVLQLLSPDDLQTILRILSSIRAAYVDAWEMDGEFIDYRQRDLGGCILKRVLLLRLRTYLENGDSFIAELNCGSIKLHFTCQSEQRAATAHDLLRVTGCVLRVYQSACDNYALYAKHGVCSSILQFSALRGLLFGVQSNLEDLQTWVNANPALRQVDDRQFKYHRFLSFEDDEQKWVGRYSSTLEPTGMSS